MSEHWLVSSKGMTQGFGYGIILIILTILGMVYIIDMHR